MERVTSTPWREILSKKPIRGLIAAYFTNVFAGYTIMWWFPTFMDEALHFSSTQIMLYGALLGIATFIGMNASGWTADHMIRRGISLSSSRKMPMYAGILGGALFLTLTAFLNSPVPTVLCLLMASFFSGLCVAPYWALTVDLAPRHAGTVAGIMNTSGNLAGIISPMLIGFIIGATGEWSYIFLIAAAVALVGLVIIATSVSAERVIE